MSTLSEAHEELTGRARQAIHSGDPDVALWESLASVGDYLRRIVDHGESRHYRADKAGELVGAALRVQRDAVVGYGGEVLDEVWVNRIYDLHRLVDQVVTQLTSAMWSAARGHDLFTWQTGDLRRAVEDLRRCTNRLCEAAVPDPDGEA